MAKAGASEAERIASLLSEGRTDDAVILCREVLEGDPNDFNALQLLGVASAQLGRMEDAAYFLSRAVKVRGNVAAVHANLGKALLALDRLEEAAASCTQALRLDPSLDHALSDLAQIQKKLGQDEKAVRSYARLRALRPKSAEALSALYATKRRICSWDGLAELEAEILDQVDSGGGHRESPSARSRSRPWAPQRPDRAVRAAG